MKSRTLNSSFLLALLLTTIVVVVVQSRYLHHLSSFYWPLRLSLASYSSSKYYRDEERVIRVVIRGSRCGVGQHKTRLATRSSSNVLVEPLQSSSSPKFFVIGAFIVPEQGNKVDEEVEEYDDDTIEEQTEGEEGVNHRLRALRTPNSLALLTLFDVHKKQKPVNLECLFVDETASSSITQGRLLAQGFDLWQRNVSVVLYCSLPSDCKLDSIDISYIDHQRNYVHNITNLFGGEDDDKSSINGDTLHACVGPLYPQGFNDGLFQFTRRQLIHLMEWIEYHRSVVNVTHFYVYVEASKRDDELMHVLLNDYRREGILTLIEWSAMRYIDTWYHAQVTAINHCILLNRARQQSQWLALLDSDEFLAPLATTSLSSLLSSFASTHSSYAAYAIGSWPFRRVELVDRKTVAAWELPSSRRPWQRLAASLGAEDFWLAWHTRRDRLPEKKEKDGNTHGWKGRRKNIVQPNRVYLHVIHQCQACRGATFDANQSVDAFIAHVCPCKLKKYEGNSIVDDFVTLKSHFVDVKDRIEQRLGALARLEASAAPDSTADSARQWRRLQSCFTTGGNNKSEFISTPPPEAPYLVLFFIDTRHQSTLLPALRHLASPFFRIQLFSPSDSSSVLDKARGLLLFTSEAVNQSIAQIVDEFNQSPRRRHRCGAVANVAIVVDIVNQHHGSIQEVIDRFVRWIPLNQAEEETQQIRNKIWEKKKHCEDL